MKNTAIVFTAPKVAEVLETPVREPGPGEVRFRTVRSCISSGTERANIVDDPTVSTTAGDGAAAVFPRHLGYSASGVVEAVGAGVSSVKPGDRVSVPAPLVERESTTPLAAGTVNRKPSTLKEVNP